MTKLLIIKLGATGDVVRTTPLLRRLSGEITWLTAAKNTALLRGLEIKVRGLSWEDRAQALDTRYDLVVNLEDTPDVAEFVRTAGDTDVLGAYLDSENTLRYTENSRAWFDLSLISCYGRPQADRLKLLNRRTYQEMIFEAFGFQFAGEQYLLPEPAQTDLAGDVAIAAAAGPVWPMKNWAYFDTLIKKLRDEGFTVNVLPKRASLLEHLADIRNHRCLVGGDSLPMHFALGTGTRCVSLFTCTSPWEIHDYGIQIKVISPRLEEFFYQRGYDRRAVTAINVEDVHRAVLVQIEGSAAERRLPQQVLR
jgi:ADP-heptose:LPS heptosyltransferase